MVYFQPPSFLIGKVKVYVMQFCVFHTLQSALESGQEAGIVQIDLSACSLGCQAEPANMDAVVYFCVQWWTGVPVLFWFSNGGLCVFPVSLFVFYHNYSMVLLWNSFRHLVIWVKFHFKMIRQASHLQIVCLKLETCHSGTIYLNAVNWKIQFQKFNNPEKKRKTSSN